MTEAVLARRHLFSAAHLYHQPKWSDEENRRVFGACFTEHGHGHNYVVEAFVAGPIDPDTKLVINLTDLDEILIHVTSTLDHKHLNFDVPEFKTKIPTTENIALYLRERFLNEMKRRAPGLRLQRLRLYETDQLWVEISE